MPDLQARGVGRLGDSAPGAGTPGAARAGRRKGGGGAPGEEGPTRNWGGARVAAVRILCEQRIF
jgi:hypothetical protein